MSTTTPIGSKTILPIQTTPSSSVFQKAIQKISNLFKRIVDFLRDLWNKTFPNKKAEALEIQLTEALAKVGSLEKGLETASKEVLEEAEKANKAQNSLELAKAAEQQALLKVQEAQANLEVIKSSSLAQVSEAQNDKMAALEKTKLAEEALLVAVAAKEAAIEQAKNAENKLATLTAEIDNHIAAKNKEESVTVEEVSEEEELEEVEPVIVPVSEPVAKPDGEPATTSEKPVEQTAPIINTVPVKKRTNLIRNVLLVIGAVSATATIIAIEHYAYTNKDKIAQMSSDLYSNLSFIRPPENSALNDFSQNGKEIFNIFGTLCTGAVNTGIGMVNGLFAMNDGANRFSKMFNHWIE